MDTKWHFMQCGFRSISRSARGAGRSGRRYRDAGERARGAQSRWAHSRRRYNAGYGVKSRADMQAVLAFFEERRGRFHSFLWRDGLDIRPCGTATPTAWTRRSGPATATTTAFQLTKTYGASFDPYLRPITKPVAGSVMVAVTGVGAAGWCGRCADRAS